MTAIGEFVLKATSDVTSSSDCYGSVGQATVILFEGSGARRRTHRVGVRRGSVRSAGESGSIVVSFMRRVVRRIGFGRGVGTRG